MATKALGVLDQSAPTVLVLAGRTKLFKSHGPLALRQLVSVFLMLPDIVDVFFYFQAHCIL